MSNLWSSEAEFHADVKSLQDGYEAKAKALQASMDDEERYRWSHRKCLPTATGPGARGDWSFNPNAAKR
jgi:hypothetical protein